LVHCDREVKRVDPESGKSCRKSGNLGLMLDARERVRSPRGLSGVFSHFTSHSEQGFGAVIVGGKLIVGVGPRSTCPAVVDTPLEVLFPKAEGRSAEDLRTASDVVVDAWGKGAPFAVVPGFVGVVSMPYRNLGYIPILSLLSQEISAFDNEYSFVRVLEDVCGGRAPEPRTNYDDIKEERLSHVPPSSCK
jgi:hypothetical protein